MCSSARSLLIGLRDTRLFLPTFFCSVVTHWAFPIFIPRHSASSFVSSYEPICLCNGALWATVPIQAPTFGILLIHFYNCLCEKYPLIGITHAWQTLVPLSTLPTGLPSSVNPFSGKPSFPLASHGRDGPEPEYLPHVG